MDNLIDDDLLEQFFSDEEDSGTQVFNEQSPVVIHKSNTLKISKAQKLKRRTNKLIKAIN